MAPSTPSWPSPLRAEATLLVLRRRQACTLLHDRCCTFVACGMLPCVAGLLPSTERLTGCVRYIVHACSQLIRHCIYCSSAYCASFVDMTVARQSIIFNDNNQATTLRIHTRDTPYVTRRVWIVFRHRCVVATGGSEICLDYIALAYPC